VALVQASDLDIGNNGQFSFSIRAGDGFNYFTVDGSGKIYTTSKLDYETQQHYSLVVEVLDSGVDPLSATCLVRVTVTDGNDNAPIFHPPEVTVDVSEDASNGAAVTSVYATDADSSASGNNVVRYSQTSPVDFSVDATTGAITTAADLDRETTARYSVRLSCLHLVSSLCSQCM
jgi:hypothetical protein